MSAGTRKSRCHLVTLLAGPLVILSLSVLASENCLEAAPHSPPHAAAPLLYVRFAVPAAAEITFFRGTPTGNEFEAPVTIGLRPGYIYRVKLAHLPDHPGAILFPTLEVRGTLHLPVHLRAADYPAPVVISEQDVALALAGGLVTKVVYLEDPTRAQVPLTPPSPPQPGGEGGVRVATRSDQPVEFTMRPGGDPVDEARAFGRPMLIVRFGARTFGPDELAASSMPGT